MPDRNENRNRTAGSVNNLKNSALFLEKLPVAGPFFEAVRENVTGDGPGTNDMKRSADKLPSGGKHESFIGKWLRDDD